MPGFTPLLALPYPTINDVINAASFQTLANAIDAQFTAIDTIRQLNLHKATANCSSLAATVVAPATNTNILFGTSTWTVPSALHSTSSNTDQFVIQTAGLYFMTAGANLIGTTTLTGFRLGLSKNGTATFGATGLENVNGNAHVKGLHFCAVGDVLRVFANWTGTGSGNVTANVQLFQMANL